MTTKQNSNLAGGCSHSRSPAGSQFVLAWSSGDKPKRTVYFQRTETGWGATYDRNEAKQFPTRSAALNQWRKVHAFPHEFEHCIHEGKVRAEDVGEPQFSF